MTGEPNAVDTYLGFSEQIFPETCWAGVAFNSLRYDSTTTDESPTRAALAARSAHLTRFGFIISSNGTPPRLKEPLAHAMTPYEGHFYSGPSGHRACPQHHT